MSSREEIKKAIEALELQRNLLGNATVDAAIYSLRKELWENSMVTYKMLTSK